VICNSAQDAADLWSQADPDDFNLARGCWSELIDHVVIEFGVNRATAIKIMRFVPSCNFQVSTAVKAVMGEEMS
jgi:hypothetical protein